MHQRSKEVRLVGLALEQWSPGEAQHGERGAHLAAPMVVF